MSDTKVCSGCGEEKHLSEFCKHPTSADRLQYQCKTCTAERLRDYRRRHPERTRARNQAYYAQNGKAVRGQSSKWHVEHPGATVMRNRARKARLAGAEGDGLTVEAWEAILDQYGRRCLACGTKERLTVDHVVPISRGGRHEAANVQPLCASCNASKGARTIDYRPLQATGTDGR